jgi:aminoglycoside phosphotransferase (APT) family kinase protein
MNEALARYLAEKLGAPDLSVHDVARIPGGASRETYRFRARYGGKERKLILRRDPQASLIETDRATEYRAYEAFFRLGIPVPEPIALELGGAALERPFFIMAEIEDAQVGSILAPDPYGAHRDHVGAQFWSILGRIAAADPKALGLDDFDGAASADACWRHEVARWEKVMDEDEGEPQPIARAALRWLKRNPPNPAQKIAVVHGDYRSGNFLYDAATGDIRAILDWEMAHLGDPLEDLAWALDPLWAHHDPGRPAGTLARADAIALWEETSGLKADPGALSWWETFASLKGCAIWISAAHEYATRRNDDPVNAFSGWYCLAYHNQVLANRLEALA